MLEFPAAGEGSLENGGEDSNGYPALPYRLALAGART
jgi:hypothetical protein